MLCMLTPSSLPAYDATPDVFINVYNRMCSSMSTTCAVTHLQARSRASGVNTSLAITSNEYSDQLHKFKAPAVLQARARGAGCFDFTFYAKENADLRALWRDPLGLWRHWVYYGQFDYRPHK